MARNKEDRREDRDDRIKLTGRITEVLPGTLFRVTVDDSKSEVLCTLSGKLRTHRITVVLGDRVELEVSPYDLSRGRISYRL